MSSIARGSVAARVSGIGTLGPVNVQGSRRARLLFCATRRLDLGARRRSWIGASARSSRSCGSHVAQQGSGRHRGASLSLSGHHSSAQASTYPCSSMGSSQVRENGVQLEHVHSELVIRTQGRAHLTDMDLDHYLALSQELPQQRKQSPHNFPRLNMASRSVVEESQGGSLRPASHP